MTHYAGLPAGIPTRGWSDIRARSTPCVALKPVAPPGTRFNYSDVDFIVLGEIVRRVSGQPLETYAAQHIFQPLGMRDTTFLPPASLKDRIAPADLEGGELRWGDVHDPLAYRMGGVAGHAGVFTTADDLTKFAQMMLGGGKGVLKPASIAAMTPPQSPPGGAALRGLGWDIDSPYAVWFAPSFSTQLLRPHRLYRHGDLDRSRDQDLPDRADQPPASRRQGQHPADAAARSPRLRALRRAASRSSAVGHRRARSLWLSPARRAAASD